MLAQKSAEKDLSGLERSTCEYFLHPANAGHINTFMQACDALHKSLAPTSAEEAQGLPSSLRNISHDDNSKHNQALFDVLQSHCRCHPDRHGAPVDNAPWHPTRLSLEGDPKGASFSILMSSLDMSCWQEFRLSP